MCPTCKYSRYVYCNPAMITLNEMHTCMFTKYCGLVSTFESSVHGTHLVKERNHTQSSAPGGAGLGGYPHILVRHLPWVRLT